MKPFYTILGNSLAAAVVNNFVWFAVTFWVFLETQSVIATSILAGVLTITIARHEPAVSRRKIMMAELASQGLVGGVHVISSNPLLSAPDSQPPYRRTSTRA